MVAMFKIFRKFFLPAVILAGSTPFAFTHWMPCLGIVPAVFAFPASPVASHQRTHQEQTARHGLCWRAEDHSGKSHQDFAAMKAPGVGEPLTFYACPAPLRPCSRPSSRAPAVLSVLRI